jgi:5,10-methylenetetrahydromethanopterin reductase
MQIGIIMPPLPRRTAQLAELAERLGFASLRVPDSQNLAPEVWGQLMLAAKATSRIELGPGVTNSVTRDPAVTASAALALQVESSGRAVCGIGRGDSAVQRIGKPTDPLASFERYVARLQSYLRGEAVDRDGFSSRIEWLPAMKVAKVPVEVTATGPRVIALAARLADRIALAVGADPDHLAWGIETAREAARRAGRDPSTLKIGAYVNCVIHSDRTVARNAVRGTVATFARFSAFSGSKLAALPGPLRAAAEHLRKHYDMAQHTRGEAEHARALEDQFIDWFAIVGPSDQVLQRFRRLTALGLDFCHVVPGSAETARDVTTGSLQTLASEIMPALGTT